MPQIQHEPLWTAPPRYRIAAVGNSVAIQLHRRTIAHANVYDRTAAGFCIAMVEAANVASTCREALKGCAAALLTMEHAGYRLPEPVRRAKDRAFAALAATQQQPLNMAKGEADQPSTR